MNHGYQVESLQTGSFVLFMLGFMAELARYLDGYVHMDCEVDYAHSRCPAQLCFLSDTNSRI